MEKCVHCKKNEGSFDFQVVEVRNLTIRNNNALQPSLAGKYSRYQELGNIKTMSVCDECIARKLEYINKPLKGYLHEGFSAILFLVLGVLLVVRFAGRDNFTFIVGLLIVFASVHRTLDYFSKAKTKKATYSKYSENNARFVAAWDCVMESAPKRDGNTRVFYIPITDATMKMSPKEFKAYYRLTIENAEAFHELLHNPRVEED